MLCSVIFSLKVESCRKLCAEAHVTVLDGDAIAGRDDAVPVKRPTFESSMLYTGQ